VIRPHAGHLIVFDGRQYPHYVRPLTSETDVRITVVMNFYTESCPESTRPQELNRHLFGWALRQRQGMRASSVTANVPLMVALPRTASPS
jgi:hypothetical protein